MASPPGLGCFLAAERLQESGGDYQAVNPSGHYGAYQFSQGTWQQAMALAGLAFSPYANMRPDKAPPSIQDAAAGALMSLYYYQFSQSWYNVAEAWYGGPGAVGHPDWGGGPGYPNVGQYADQVMAKYRACGGTVTVGVPGPQLGSPWSTQWTGNFVTYYIQVIEPMGRVWRAASRGLPPGFFTPPGRV